MSVFYPTLTETNFPDGVDDLTRMSDLTITDLPLVALYYQYYNAGDLTSASNLLNQNPQINAKLFNAAKFNKLADGIVAMQKFFNSNVQGYIVTKQQEFNAYINAFDFKSAYNAATSYVAKNLVTIFGCTYICRVACKGVSPVDGASSTNWGLIAEKGEQGIQGASGTGLSPRGLWSTSIVYYVNDCVSYNNALWQCLVGNTGSAPTTSNTKWLRVLTIPITDFATSTHTHGAISNTGAIGTSSGLPVFTGANGVLGVLPAANAVTALGAVPASSKGQANGVAPLDANGKVVLTHIPNTIHTGSTAPANTGILWIDPNVTTGGLKYYNSSAWVHVPVAYKA